MPLLEVLVQLQQYVSVINKDSNVLKKVDYRLNHNQYLLRLCPVFSFDRSASLRQH